jgi:hypothetical protein
VEARTLNQYAIAPLVERLWQSLHDELELEYGLAYRRAPAREALRHGFFAAFFWPAEESWSSGLEALLERDWIMRPRPLAWAEALVLVRHGWNEGRRRVTSYPGAASSSDREEHAREEACAC